LHPRAFRKEFGDELLWIFDEVRYQERLRRLFLDVFLSLVRQHAQAEDLVESRTGGFGLEIDSSNLTLLPLLRATVLASLIIVGFVTLAGSSQPMDFPTNSFPSPRVYRPTCEDFKNDMVGEQAISSRAGKVKRTAIHASEK
jgi:hypothetical protein